MIINDLKNKDSRMNSFRIILIIVSISFLIFYADAQVLFRYNEGAENTFSNAMHLFNNRDEGGALRLFQKLIDQNPVHQRTSAAYIMAGKTLHRLGRYTESIRLLKTFISTYPTSTYLHDAEYTLAVNFMMVQQPNEACIHLLNALDDTTDRRSYQESLSLLRSVPAERINDSTLREEYEDARNPDARDILALKIAEKELHSGHSQNAGTYLKEIIQRTPKSRFEPDAIRMQEMLTTVKNVKIGVLLPFMKRSDQSQIKTVSEEILNGITYAVENARANSKWNGSVSLDIRDTEKDPKIARTQLEELAGDKNVIGVIGPLFSNVARECATIAEKEEIPMLTPTATTNGIANVGKYVFQLTPDYENRGKAMAEFAVKDLGYTRLGILASSEPGGKATAEGFIKEAERLGATIVGIEFYTKGASDLSEQFQALRKKSSQVGAKNDYTRNLDVAVSGIQGLFIPIGDAEDIGIIASQLKYFNINTTILGSDEWYDYAQIDLNKRYLGRLYFLSDSYIDENNGQYQDFVRSYSALTKKVPTKYSIIGYDVMNVVLGTIHSGAVTREALIEGLSHVQQYEGIHSRISLVRRRVNSELRILQYQNGEIQIIKNISVR